MRNVAQRDTRRRQETGKFTLEFRAKYFLLKISKKKLLGTYFYQFRANIQFSKCLVRPFIKIGNRRMARSSFEILDT